MSLDGVTEMLINADAGYNRITESYIKAASFENTKEAPLLQAKPDDLQLNGEAPAYVVNISEEAKEMANEQQDGKEKEGSEGEENKAAEAQEPWRKGKSEPEQKQVEQEVKGMEKTQAEVIQHENAHKSVGGQYAGSISYEKTAGPDGKQYIVGGEVSIDTSSEDTPQKTIAKMQVVKRAALAPANPSGADRSAASTASAKEAEARQELSEEMRENAMKAVSGKTGAEKDEIKTFKDQKAKKQEPNMGGIVDLSA